MGSTTVRLVLAVAYAVAVSAAGVRTEPIAWLAVMALPTAVGAQSRDAAFDVVSIRRSMAIERGGGRSGLQPGGRYVMTNGPVRVMLNMAFRTPTGEIIGAPDWVTSDNYDVDARAGHEIAFDELAPRLRTLLADRFRLKAHLETRVRPMYELRVASRDGTLGPDIRPSAVDCEARRNACSTRGDTGVIESNGISMTSFASWLPARIGRPVFDKTNLPGYYELRLTYAPAPGGIDRVGPTDAADAAPALPTALREQLGLRLDAIDAPTEVLVIDHIERPSDN